MSDNIAVVNRALDSFIEGAKIRHTGNYLGDVKMQDRGLNLIFAATKTIDERSLVGRNVLLPLLHHESPEVQVTAAGGLWQSHPDLVMPLLEDLKLNCLTEAGDTAMWLLFSHGQMNACGSDPRFPSLYSDEANTRPWGSAGNKT